MTPIDHRKTFLSEAASASAPLSRLEVSLVCAAAREGRRPRDDPILPGKGVGIGEAPGLWRGTWFEAVLGLMSTVALWS